MELQMFSFADWMKNKIKNEYYGGNAGDPSGVNDEGDGGDGVIKRLEKTGGAFPQYGDDLPITNKNRRNKIKQMKKK
jgi:hypothetical protein